MSDCVQEQGGDLPVSTDAGIVCPLHATSVTFVYYMARFELKFAVYDLLPYDHRQVGSLLGQD